MRDLGGQPIENGLTVTLRLHETRLAQDPKVMGKPALIEAENRVDLAYMPRARAQRPDNREARPFGEDL